jgi:hypothetical protein
MSIAPTTLLWLAAGCGLFVRDVAAAEAADPAGNVIVRKIVGAARCNPGAAWRELGVGDELRPGTVVRTGKESHVELEFPELGITVSLLEDSTVSLNKLNSEKTRGEVVCNHELELKAGRMEAVIRRLAATSKFEVKVPEGVIGVRRAGTRFSFAADCALSVDRGAVVLVYLNEKKSGKDVASFVVSAGEKFNPASVKVEPIGK